MRVTVRQFSAKKVEPEKLQKILEAGRWSPTAVNYQPQRSLALNTPENFDYIMLETASIALEWYGLVTSMKTRLRTS